MIPTTIIAESALKIASSANSVSRRNGVTAVSAK